MKGANSKINTLFDLGEYPPESKEPWEKHWQGMPEFIQKDMSPHQKVIVNFESLEDVQAFSILVGQKITKKTDSMWYPPKQFDSVKLRRYTDESSLPSLCDFKGKAQESNDSQGSGENGD